MTHHQKIRLLVLIEDAVDTAVKEERAIVARRKADAALKEHIDSLVEKDEA